jgi:hypothetical protein
MIRFTKSYIFFHILCYIIPCLKKKFIFNREEAYWIEETIEETIEVEVHIMEKDEEETEISEDEERVDLIITSDEVCITYGCEREIMYSFERNNFNYMYLKNVK